MICVTCGPLEGEFVCLCRALTGGSLFHGGTRSLGPSLGHEAHRLDDAPPLLGHMGRGTLPLEALGHHEMSMFQPFTPQRWPWKAQNVTFYALDVT
jgi:hypothetical protein